MSGSIDRNGDGIYEVVAIVGSLRRQSFNRGLLRAAQELKPESMRIVEAPLAAIPLYNEDVEREGDPPAVQALKAAILDADAVLILTPEYNHSIPGVLKNAIDWASRRYGTASVLKGKPVAITGAAAGRFGTARAQLHLRQIFPYLDMRLMPQPELYVASAGDAFDDTGRLTDDRVRESLQAFLESLLTWTKQVGSA